MDKFMETPWFLKVIALSLASLLFISVNFEPSTDSLGFNTPAQTSSEGVESMPVEVYYDRGNWVVTGVPETVDVTLTGPKNLVITAKNQREFKVYVDLSDPEIQLGDRTISVQIRDLNEKISYTIDPATIDISIQEKVTAEFEVQPEFDRSLLKDGYIAKEPTVNPSTVEITGAKDVIENIAYVKANINIEDGVYETIYRDAQVQALDSDLNKLNVKIEPSVVTVEVPIVSPSKTMTIQPVASGTAMDGIEIVSLTAEPTKITLYGKQSVLDTIEQLQVPIDISKIEEDTDLTVNVDLPEGINSASVKDIKVTVKTRQVDEPVTEESEEVEDITVSKTFPNISINTLDLKEDYNLVFLDPEQGTTDVLVTGLQSLLNTLKTSDIDVSINVSGLQEGEHTVPLKLKLPSDIGGKTLISSAKLFIAKNVGDEPVDGEIIEETS